MRQRGAEDWARFAQARRAGVAKRLRKARELAAKGNDADARQLYLDVLRVRPNHLAALIEFAVLASSGGYRQAAHTAYLRAIEIAPDHPVAQVGLGNLLAEDADHVGAEIHYRAALAADSGFAPAHQGLARSLSALGAAEAELHWQAGFARHAVVRQRYRGAGSGIPLLLLVSARGGNIPTKHWIDNRIFAVTAVYADFVGQGQTLPEHALILNAIGDADLCGDALAGAEQIIASGMSPVINHPARVGLTGRENNARRLATIPGVIVPRIAKQTRDTLMESSLRFPVLLRSPGFHTGQNFVMAESHAMLAQAAAILPGDELLVIDYLDARGSDGMARKYRVMFIDGATYPLHLAMSTDWKVHYFTAAMAGNATLREEERRFLTDMPAVLGQRAMAALAAIGEVLGLDYAGVDFALTPDGSMLLFEANATMMINPPDADPIWDYRRPAIIAAQNAARQMLLHRACCMIGEEQSRQV